MNYEGPGQKSLDYKVPYQYGHCRALKAPVAPRSLSSPVFLANDYRNSTLQSIQLVIRALQLQGLHSVRERRVKRGR
jgi:hypothetical protein